MAQHITVKWAQLEKACRLRELNSDAEIAQFIGVTGATISRVKNRKRGVSDRLITAVLGAFGPFGYVFEDFFEVTDTDDEADSAA